MSRAVVRWTPAARARVLDLYGRPGESGSTIAHALATEFGLTVSPSAVIGIAFRGAVAERRVKLSPEERLVRSRDRKRAARAAAREGRPAPAWAVSPAKAPRKDPAPRKPRAPRPLKVAKIAPAPRLAAAPKPVLVPAALPLSLRIPLIAAPIGVCRFIADDPRQGPALVCGHATADGSPWCPGHRAICTQPAGRPVWVPGLRRAA